MQKCYTLNFLTHQVRRNTGQRRIYYETDHHEAIVSRDEHARALLLLKANHNSPFFNHLYEVKVIKRGLLSGFIPMNLAFGGYDAGHYLGALVMARISHRNIEAEIAHIAGVKRVRRELFGDKDTAIATMSRFGISFSSGCISLLKETAYVEVLLHPNERLFTVRKTTKRNKNAVPWNSHAIPARELSRVIYELMGWQKDWKYKVTANYFTKTDEQVIIFDLNCCEFRFRDGGHGDKPTRAIPSEWLSEFGDGLPEYMMLCRRVLANGLDKWDVDASASSVDAFGFKPLSRGEAEKRIAEMREHDG